MRRSRRKKQNANPPAQTPVRRRLLLPAATALVVGIVIAVGVWWIKAHRAGAPSTVEPTLTAPSDLRFAKLIGKWQRPDGGYIIDIKSVDHGGKMDAAYFNPKPIHVAKAEASRSNGAAHVFIELRDINYPGSTYHLKYDSKNDRFQGIYFQAVEKQNFDVFFLRVPQ